MSFLDFHREYLCCKRRTTCSLEKASGWGRKLCCELFSADEMSGCPSDDRSTVSDSIVKVLELEEVRSKLVGFASVLKDKIITKGMKIALEKAASYGDMGK